jgi:hypothetical protein
MLKPKIIFSGNSRFTDAEIFEMAESFPDNFKVEPNRMEEFQADELLPYLVILFLNPISQGYLQSIGSNLWSITKNKIVSILQKKNSKYDINFRFICNEQEIDFRLRTNNSEVFSDAFDKVIELAKKSENGFFHEEYEYNTEKKYWDKI